MPAFVEIDTLNPNPREEVEQACVAIGDVWKNGANVVIESNVSTVAAMTLVLRHAREMVHAWPTTTVIIATRPTEYMARQEGTVRMPLLKEPVALELVSRFAGVEQTTYGWPKSVRDTISRPLFAILLGNFLRRRAIGAVRTKADLIAALVQESIQNSGLDMEAGDARLAEVAEKSMERGGGKVPLAHFAGNWEIQRLDETGIIQIVDGGVGFTLPIMAEWFAARALARSPSIINAVACVPARLEQWRYPLVIVAGTCSPNVISEVLAPVARCDPGFSAEIIEDAVSHWELDEEVLPPPAMECGKQIRACMEAWAAGLGKIAKNITPIKSDGKVFPVATRIWGAWLVQKWYTGPDDVGDVLALPEDVPVIGPDPTGKWAGGKAARPGRSPAWAWRWTLEECSSRMSTLLADNFLPPLDGPMVHEHAWKIATSLKGAGTLFHDAIDITELQSILTTMPFTPTTRLQVGSRVLALGPFTDYIRRLDELGERRLTPPWPGPDLPAREPFIWSGYSDQRVLDRVRAIFSAAIEIYDQLTRRYFEPFRDRLSIAGTLPARLIGSLHANSGGGGAWMTWYLEPVKEPSRTYVDIEINRALPYGSEILRQLLEIAATLRPLIASTRGVGYHNEAVDVKIFRSMPATDLALEWLWKDLRQISWVTDNYPSRD